MSLSRQLSLLKGYVIWLAWPICKLRLIKSRNKGLSRKDPINRVCYPCTRTHTFCGPMNLDNFAHSSFAILFVVLETYSCGCWWWRLWDFPSWWWWSISCFWSGRYWPLPKWSTEPNLQGSRGPASFAILLKQRGAGWCDLGKVLQYLVSSEEPDFETSGLIKGNSYIHWVRIFFSGYIKAKDGNAHFEICPFFFHLSNSYGVSSPVFNKMSLWGRWQPINDTIV